MGTEQAKKEWDEDAEFYTIDHLHPEMGGNSPIRNSEVEHFYGTKAFEIMKHMTKQEMSQFLDLTKDDEDPEFPHIKEYRRFIKECLQDKDGFIGA